jgi:hypothetical protein
MENSRKQFLKKLFTSATASVAINLISIAYTCNCKEIE